MFRRKNKDVVIPVLGPHDNLSAQEYKIPSLLENFEAGFEQICRRYLQHTNPDEYNCSYMDLRIDQLEKQALVMLEDQEVSHQSVIVNLGKIWIGDEIRAEIKLAQVLEEKKNIEIEIEKTERVYYHKTAFEEVNKQSMITGKEEDIHVHA